jgi:putative peptide zinc metalloprotease protein
MGIYMVWPAFYTDVTDSYRLPRRDRLRVDLGGIYFNAIVSVATLGVWLAWREDALLLLIALQLLMIVKNLSPVIRSDGYHILADATGVPDLYAHLGPTLRRLIPGHHREPSALKGRARALVTVWVLVVVPVLLSMMVGAVLLLPRLLASSWDSGRTIASSVPHEGAAQGAADVLRLVALLLPLLGSALVTQKLFRMVGGKALAWSEGRPARRALVSAVALAALCGTAWALWPSGQYRPVRPTDGGTLVAFRTVLASPASVARPAPVAAAPLHLAPGTHLAVSMIPVGGATKRHPALFVIPGKGDDPAVAIVAAETPEDGAAPTTTDPTVTATTDQATTTTTADTQQPAAQPVAAQAFPFRLPKAPGPGGTQAVAVNTTDGAVKYDIAYALVTIRDGADVTNTNSAFALASCNACTTVAVSFQVVLIVGRSKLIAPIDAAGALNVDCPACVTTAIADQIVVTLKSEPTPELVRKIDDALKQLDAISTLGANGTPAAIAATVLSVQKQIDDALAASGQVANPPPTTTSTTTAATTTSATTTAATTTTRSTTTTPTTTSQTTTSAAVSPQTTAATTTTTHATTTTTAPTTTTSSTTTTATTTSATTTTTETQTTTATTTTTGG